MLGVATLGFYVDSAFAELRFDRALLLIVATALLNIGADQLSLHIRRRLQLQPATERL
jgi:phosphonate transport system permease protein